MTKRTVNNQDSVHGSEKQIEILGKEAIDMVLELPGTRNTGPIVDRFKDRTTFQSSHNQSISSQGSKRVSKKTDSTAGGLKMKRLEKKVETMEADFSGIKNNVSFLGKKIAQQHTHTHALITTLTKNMDNLLKIRRQADIGDRKRIAKQKDTLD